MSTPDQVTCPWSTVYWRFHCPTVWHWLYSLADWQRRNNCRRAICIPLMRDNTRQNSCLCFPTHVNSQLGYLTRRSAVQLLVAETCTSSAPWRGNAPRISRWKVSDGWAICVWHLEWRLCRKCEVCGIYGIPDLWLKPVSAVFLRNIPLSLCRYLCMISENVVSCFMKWRIITNVSGGWRNFASHGICMNLHIASGVIRNSVCSEASQNLQLIILYHQG